jgi:hypothetical protein
MFIDPAEITPPMRSKFFRPYHRRPAPPGNKKYLRPTVLGYSIDRWPAVLLDCVQAGYIVDQ